MHYLDKINKCRRFLFELEKTLDGKYELVRSCNQDISCYLIPIGTESEISYYGKPDKSFRFSDHWSWYSNHKKCKVDDYVQCYSYDAPKPNKRKGPGMASEPVNAIQVAAIGIDGQYHCVFGEKYDKKSKKWTWIENEAQDIAKMYAY